jgi:flagellar basal body-associated protein FliL
MLKNKKIMLAIALPILLLGAYTMTKHKPVPKEKIKGTIYVMPKEFLINLRDGRYAKVSVALDLAPGQSDGATADSGGSGSGETPAGTLPEEPLVREIVTNMITDQTGEQLISASGRRTIRREIADAIRQQTDVKVESVLIPDITVQ